MGFAYRGGMQAEHFTWQHCKDGRLEIRHRGLLAAVVPARQAAALLQKLARLNEAEVQRQLAILTGNYRRGNERAASGHARNRQTP